MSEKDFDTLEYSEITFYVEQLVSEDRKREQQLSRQAAFITYSMGAAPPDTTYESYLTSLGLIDDSETMTKEEKQAIAMRAHDNANKVLEYYKDLEERNKAVNNGT